MNYRNDKYGNPLSVLGYGCMRFPRKAGKIDLKKTEEQLLFFIFYPYYWKVKTSRGRTLDIIYCFHNQDSLVKEEK